MSRVMSTFVLAIQRKFNDYSAYTQDLIYESVNQRIQDYERRSLRPSMNFSEQFTLVASTRNYTLTGYSNKDYRVPYIQKIIRDYDGKTLEHMALERYLELGLHMTSDTAQYPTNYIPLTDKTFALYPLPSSSTTTLTMFGAKKHPFMSASGMYFHFDDDEVDILKHGVVADIYEDKDDSRYQLAEAKYREAVRLKRKEKYIAGKNNASLKQGNSVE